MGYFESCLIPPAIYERDIDRRLRVTSGVEVGRVVSLMVCLAENKAVKTPIRFEHQPEPDGESGLLYVARASFLDLDLQPILQHTLGFDEDSFYKPDPNISFEGYRALGGYVVSYGDGLNTTFEFPPQAILALGPRKNVQ